MKHGNLWNALAASKDELKKTQTTCQQVTRRLLAQPLKNEHRSQRRPKRRDAQRYI